MPFFILKTPTVRIKPREILTEDEIWRLFTASKYNRRDNAIIKVLYYTAIRKGELIKLNVEHIYFENKTITTWYAKGGYSDVRNIHDKALESIKEYLDYRYVNPQPIRRNEETDEEYHKRIRDNNECLFLNKTGTGRIGKSDIHYGLKKYAIMSGIQKIVYPHMLRRSSSTHLYQNGLGIVEVQAITKHRNIDTLTKHYINPSKERVTKLYNDAFDTLENNPKPNPEKPKPQDKQPELPKPNHNTSDNYKVKEDTITIIKDALARMIQAEIEKREIDKKYSNDYYG